MCKGTCSVHGCLHSPAQPNPIVSFVCAPFSRPCVTYKTFWLDRGTFTILSSTVGYVTHTRFIMPPRQSSVPGNTPVCSFQHHKLHQCVIIAVSCCLICLEAYLRALSKHIPVIQLQVSPTSLLLTWGSFHTAMQLCVVYINACLFVAHSGIWRVQCATSLLSCKSRAELRAVVHIPKTHAQVEAHSVSLSCITTEPAYTIRVSIAAYGFPLLKH